MQLNLKKQNIILLAFSYFLLLIFNFTSCTKSDFSHQQIIIDYEKFFRLPENAPEVLKRIVLNMKIQEAQKPFIEDFIKNQGYPNWQYAKLSIPKASYNSIESNSDTLISVPIVQNGRQYLKSVLAVKVNSDVWYKLLDGIKYRELPLEESSTETTFTAGEFLKLMMEMELHIFGQNNFKITDTGIAIYNRVGGFYIPNYSIQLQFANGCTIFNYGTYNNYGAFTVESSETVCLYETGVLNYTLTVPQTGVEPGGGGGSSGGSSSNNEECERGFIGIIGFGTGGMPIIPCPIISDPWDSTPSLISQKCSREMDSLYQWGMTNGFREHSFILVKKNDSIYPKNFFPGLPVGNITKVNYTLVSGEELIAYIHIHAEDTTIYSRTAFSGEDLQQFNKFSRTITNYTAIVEVGNARYAFVAEDPSKIFAFNIEKRGNHGELYENLLYQISNQFTNGQIATEQAWIQYLGSSSSSGIGFYKSTAPNKNNFIKLN